jgi:hypothetical protein
MDYNIEIIIITKNKVNNKVYDYNHYYYNNIDNLLEILCKYEINIEEIISSIHEYKKVDISFELKNKIMIDLHININSVDNYINFYRNNILSKPIITDSKYIVGIQIVNKYNINDVHSHKDEDEIFNTYLSVYNNKFLLNFIDYETCNNNLLQLLIFLELTIVKFSKEQLISLLLSGVSFVLDKDNIEQHNEQHIKCLDVSYLINMFFINIKLLNMNNKLVNMIYNEYLEIKSVLNSYNN